MEDQQFSTHERLYVLTLRRILDLSLFAGDGSLEEAVQETIIDLACLEENWEPIILPFVWYSANALARRAKEWLNAQTPETLERRREAALQVLEEEGQKYHPRLRPDYSKQFFQAVAVYGIFGSGPMRESSQTLDPSFHQICDPEHDPGTKKGTGTRNALGRRGERDRMEDELADVSRAREVISILAHGYYHEGLGGGISMDHIMEAALDLRALGCGQDILLPITRESIMYRFEGLINEWENSRNPAKDELRREKAKLQLRLASSCSCSSPGEGDGPPLEQVRKPL